MNSKAIEAGIEEIYYFSVDDDKTTYAYDKFGLESTPYLVYIEDGEIYSTTSDSQYKSLTDFNLIYQRFFNDTLKKPEPTNYGYDLLSLDNILSPVDQATLETMMDDNKTFYLFVGRPSCPDCQGAIGFINDAAVANGIDKIYYYSTDDNSSDFIKAEPFKMTYVPTVYYIVDGKIVDFNVYDYSIPYSYEVYDEFYKTNQNR